jgi:PAS domain S-box-containing protein
VNDPRPTSQSDPAPHVVIDISERRNGDLLAQRFAAIVETSDDAIISKDLNGIIATWNKGAERLFGYTAEEAIGQPVTMLIPADRLDEEPSIIARLLRNERIDHYETVRRRKDGSLVHVSLSVSPIRDERGRVIGAAKIARDITAGKRAQDLAQRLAAIVDGSDDAIISKNLNGIIASWNKAAERLFGYTAEEAIGQPVIMLIPADRHDEEPSIIARLLRSERIEHFETVRRRKDGSLVEISLTISPIKDAHGRVVGASKIARDITEQKLANERIQLLAHEVDHRAKNLLALIQATVHLSHAESAQGLKNAIEGRLQAISSAHSLFAQSRWQGADLRTLITQELAPYGPTSGKRAQYRGPEVLLDPNAAQSIAIVMHELTTNAVKYGALSGDTGRLAVEWSQGPEGVVIRWTETDGPPVAAPAQRRGFGTRVIEQLVELQIRGTVRFDWQPTGLVCRITLPPRGAAIPLS